MNDQEHFRRKTQDQRDRETDATLAGLGITPSEASLFHVIQFGLTVPPSDLCRRAAFSDYSLGGPVTIEENQAALADCLSKGWLQVIDEAALGRIQDEIHRHGLIGPVYDYPSLGGVDFTHTGAEQWFRTCERLWGTERDKLFAFCDVIHEKTAHYFRSKSKAVAERESMKEWENVSVAGPFPIGPWRANWWRWFPEGYRIDVEEKMKWSGRCSDGGGYVYFERVELPISLPHAQDVLNRHNVAWVEWLVMASLEHTTDHHSVVYEAARSSKRLGITFSKAECLSGLDVCLRNGWLRRVDDSLTAEITSLLRADAAVMPVIFDPVEHSLGEVDFSAEGALLYRTVSAEIFGPDWEDGVVVEESYFREEHRYCVTEAGLEAVIQEYTESGEIPVFIRTVPIGPWCVYWWKQFRSGYRMELTFGEL